MAKVLIADDHALVRAGLRQFLEQDPQVTEIGEAVSGSNTLDMLRAKQWDLLLLDIFMPDRSGLDTLARVRALHPNTRVLVLSGYPERQYAISVLRSGANGFLSKESAAEELSKAVKTVLAGRRYVSAALADFLVSDLDADVTKPLHASLSEREFQTLCKLAAGRSVSEIADELCISVKTVSTYRARVLEKMGMKTTAELMHYGIQHGLVD